MGGLGSSLWNKSNMAQWAVHKLPSAELELPLASCAERAKGMDAPCNILPEYSVLQGQPGLNKNFKIGPVLCILEALRSYGNS